MNGKQAKKLRRFARKLSAATQLSEEAANKALKKHYRKAWKDRHHTVHKEVQK